MAFTMASKGGPAAEMNVTPMIDILLVLIIIFMIIQTHNYGEAAQIPQPQPPDARNIVQSHATVVLEVHAAGSEATLSLNQHAVAWKELRQQLLDIYKQRAQRVLFIKADDALEFAPVADAIDMAHAAYPDIKVGLITAKLASGG